jgi:hypothetical protein
VRAQAAFRRSPRMGHWEIRGGFATKASCPPEAWPCPSAVALTRGAWIGERLPGRCPRGVPERSSRFRGKAPRLPSRSQRNRLRPRSRPDAKTRNLDVQSRAAGHEMPAVRQGSRLRPVTDPVDSPSAREPANGPASPPVTGGTRRGRRRRCLRARASRTLQNEDPCAEVLDLSGEAGHQLDHSPEQLSHPCCGVCGLPS